MSDFDLAIVGGGINGAGIARDAAGRGLRVLLVEQSDLASGTSSASTKLIHGGLRYLEHGWFRLVREALIEREVMLRMAPHLIRPMRFVLPVEPGMRSLMVHLDNVAGDPELQFADSQRRVFLGIIALAVPSIRKRRTRKSMDFARKSPHQTFNVAAIMGLTHGSEKELDSILLARLAEHRASKVFSVVAVDAAHPSPHRPPSWDVPFGKQSILR